MTNLDAANKLFERHRDWSLAVAGCAIRRIGPQADREEIQQVAQAATWERALAFDPARWTRKPRGDPFQLYAYPSVYGACLMTGYRGAAGRAKAPGGGYVAFIPLETAVETAAPGEQAAVEVSIDGACLRRLIALLIDELPKRERWLVAEHYLGGASLAAIAESLHTSPSSVSRIHAEALRLLRLAAERHGMKAGEWL